MNLLVHCWLTDASIQKDVIFEGGDTPEHSERSECSGRKETIHVRLWAYFTTNIGNIYKIDNAPLFQLIRDGGLEEDSVFTDDATDGYGELDRLLEVVERGDTVMVRSLVDLADDGTGLVERLRAFRDKGVEVVSISEEWYEGAVEQVERVVILERAMAEKKRRLGMERAREDGRMGRKADQTKKERMAKLRNAGMTVEEVCDLCGVSRSTYYRGSGKK